MALTKQQILAASKPKIESVHVPQWGEDPVLIRSVTAGEKGEFEEWLARDVGDGGYDRGIRLRIFALCVVDEEGRRLFTNSDKDLETIGSLDHGGVETVVEAANALNKLMARKGEPENPSSGGEVDTSGTGSPSGSE